MTLFLSWRSRFLAFYSSSFDVLNFAIFQIYQFSGIVIHGMAFELEAIGEGLVNGIFVAFVLVFLIDHGC